MRVYTGLLNASRGAFQQLMPSFAVLEEQSSAVLQLWTDVVTVQSLLSSCNFCCCYSIGSWRQQNPPATQHSKGFAPGVRGLKFVTEEAISEKFLQMYKGQGISLQAAQWSWVYGPVICAYKLQISLLLLAKTLYCSTFSVHSTACHAKPSCCDGNTACCGARHLTALKHFPVQMSIKLCSSFVRWVNTMTRHSWATGLLSRNLLVGSAVSGAGFARGKPAFHCWLAFCASKLAPTSQLRPLLILQQET